MQPLSELITIYKGLIVHEVEKIWLTFKPASMEEEYKITTRWWPKGDIKRIATLVLLSNCVKVVTTN